jgi:hypothetical protein
MALNTPPIGYTGEVQTGSNTSQLKEGIVRAATSAEAAQGTRTDIYLSPATSSSGLVAFSGTTDAMTGTPGEVVVTNPLVKATSVIIFNRATTGGTAGQVSITAQTDGSFTLTSSANETSTFNYFIIG